MSGALHQRKISMDVLQPQELCINTSLTWQLLYSDAW